MQPRTEQSKLRRWLRRGLKCLVGLIFLSAGALVLADVWHQYTLGKRVNELRATIADVERDVQGGVPARDWHESRIKGTNGWKYVKVLWDTQEAVRNMEEEHGRYYVRRSAQGQTWNACEQLADYFRGEWREEPEDPPENFVPRTTPTHKELGELLHATRMLPEPVRQAADCDVVTPVPDPREVTDTWDQHASPFSGGTIGLALLGRAMALRELGRTTEAEEELLVSARFWSKYLLPLNFTDGHVGSGQAAASLIYAEKLLSEGVLSVGTAEAIVNLEFDGDSLLAQTITADAVWSCLLMQREPNLLQEPRWFEWMSRKKSAMFGYGIHDYPYGNRAFECDNCTRALLNDMRSIEQLERRLPWAEIAETLPAGDNYYGLVAETLPQHSISFRNLNVRWLALKLRLMERTAGPLLEHRQEVEELLVHYDFARHEWEGNTLVLYAVPILESAPDFEDYRSYPVFALAPAK